VQGIESQLTDSVRVKSLQDHARDLHFYDTTQDSEPAPIPVPGAGPVPADGTAPTDHPVPDVTAATHDSGRGDGGQ
jgi:hypothetical protein